MTNSKPGIPPGERGPETESTRHPPAPGQNISTLPDGGTGGKEGVRGGTGPRGPRPALSFRRPEAPWPIERYELTHPAVPTVLEGLTILHVTDLHVRKGRPLPAVTTRAIGALRAAPADLVVFTGDYMNHPGDEASAMVALRELVGACRARLGVFGVFGNHDTWELRRAAAGIPGITWLRPESPVAWPDPMVRLVGVDEPEDLLSALVGAGVAAPTRPAIGGGEAFERSAVQEPITLALVHYPSEVFAGADFNIPVLFAGHTHGGQFRATPRFAPHTSCDLPRDRASGVLRLRRTLCCVSRGLGNAVVELRVNCPVQLPMYVLRRGELPVLGEGEAEKLTLHAAW